MNKSNETSAKIENKTDQSTIAKAQSSRYFKYAFGEIVLVVVGILIALQINNWNETRKNRQFERKIVELIDSNIIQDSINISKELRQAKLGMATTNQLIAEVKQGIYNDSLDYMLGRIINFQRFKSQSSAFEVLKSKGIENISNNELQIGLISYYDQFLFNLYESISDVEDSFVADWIPLLKQEFSDFKWKQYCTPIDKKNFFEKPSTILLFKLYDDNRAGMVTSMERTLNKITQIRKLIKSTTYD